MKVEEKQLVEKEQYPLGTIAKGAVFYFTADGYQNAISENAIYMVVHGGKDDRVQIVNLHDGLIMQRDSCHFVTPLQSKIVINK